VGEVDEMGGTSWRDAALRRKGFYARSPVRSSADRLELFAASILRQLVEEPVFRAAADDMNCPMRFPTDVFQISKNKRY